MPARRSPGRPGPARGEAPDRGARGPEPLAQLGSRHVGLAHSLSLGHCTAGQGGLLRGPWIPCQPSLGPAPWAFPGHPCRGRQPQMVTFVCVISGITGVIPQVAQRRRVQCISLPGFTLWRLCGHCSPQPALGHRRDGARLPAQGGTMRLEAPVSCTAVCLWPLVPCLLLGICGPSSTTHPAAAAYPLEHFHFLSLPFVTSTSFQWTDWPLGLVCLRVSEWTVSLCRVPATCHPCSRDSGCFSCPCAPHQLWGSHPFWAFLG